MTMRERLRAMLTHVSEARDLLLFGEVSDHDPASALYRATAASERSLARLEAQIEKALKADQS